MKRIFIVFCAVVAGALNMDAQSGAHIVNYTKNSSGVHVLMTDGSITVENTDNAFVLGNLSMIYTDSNDAPYPIVSLIFEEMDTRGRVGQLLTRQKAQISITLSNGEVFTCPSSDTMIKKGYAVLGNAVSLNFAILNMTSTNSPSGSIEKSRYAMKQLCSYDIVKVTADNCTFEVKGRSDSQLRSAPTFMEMCRILRSSVTNKQCLNF